MLIFLTVFFLDLLFSCFSLLFLRIFLNTYFGYFSSYFAFLILRARQLCTIYIFNRIYELFSYLLSNFCCFELIVTAFVVAAFSSLVQKF